MHIIASLFYCNDLMLFCYLCATYFSYYCCCCCQYYYYYHLDFNTLFFTFGYIFIFFIVHCTATQQYSCRA